VQLPPAVQRVVTRVERWPAVRTLREVMQTFDAAGNGLLAGGLTYSALFALLPALLLLAVVLGLAIDDPERRRAIVDALVDAVPPLRGVIEEGLAQMGEGAVSFGTLGLIGLAWGASRFYGSLDDAFARIFASAPKRGFVDRTVRGVASVVLLVTAFLGALILTGIGSYLAAETAAALGTETRVFWQVVTPVLSAGVFILAVAAVYRLVPARPVPWSALVVPAVVVGVVLAVITQLFSLVAPRLIGSAAVYGTFVAIFALMIWLSLLFQVLLLGAAWVRIRLGSPAPRM
jgi:membrane protein